MNTQSSLQRTLQTLYVTGISIFALTPADEKLHRELQLR